MSVYVPTVEREFDAGFRCSITIAIGRFSIASTCGRPYLGRYCWVNDGNVSFNSLRDFAAIVSSTSDDFPEPETPVTTVICFFGIFTETFFKLFSVAPRTSIYSCIIKSFFHNGCHGVTALHNNQFNTSTNILFPAVPLAMRALVNDRNLHTYKYNIRHFSV